MSKNDDQIKSSGFFDSSKIRPKPWLLCETENPEDPIIVFPENDCTDPRFSVSLTKEELKLLCWCRNKLLKE